MSDKTIKLSEMTVGDFGIIGGDNTVAQLRDNGRQGGCDTDLWLAYVGDVGDDAAAQQYGWDADGLCTIIEDTDQVSGMPQSDWPPLRPISEEHYYFLSIFFASRAARKI